ALVVERIARDLQAAGAVPLEWYDVLLALSDARGRRLRMHALAEAMVLNRSNATRLADRLEAAGLLRRAPTPGDRRGAFAVLTDAGAEALRAADAVYASAVNSLFGRHLSSDEVDMSAGVCGRRIGRLEQERGD